MCYGVIQLHTTGPQAKNQEQQKKKIDWKKEKR